MREIPWFVPRRVRNLSATSDAQNRVSEAFSNEWHDAEGSSLFMPMHTVLFGFIEWADDPDAPAPYRVVRGWQNQ